MSALLVLACAMEEEAAPFLAALEPDKTVASPVVPESYRGPATFHSGRLFGRPAIVITTGIGMTNAATAATVALTQVRPEAYILAGTTGGLGSHVNIGHGIVAASALYHDADASAFGYKPGQIPQMPARYEADPRFVAAMVKVAAERTGGEAPAHVGQVSASNSFVTASQVPPVRAAFPEVLAVDMETAAAAQVCWAFDVPWISLRAVSDMCDPNAAEVFDAGVPDATQVSFRLVKDFIETLHGV